MNIIKTILLKTGSLLTFLSAIELMSLMSMNEINISSWWVFPLSAIVLLSGIIFFIGKIEKRPNRNKEILDDIFLDQK
jgi:hypothetical protein